MKDILNFKDMQYENLINKLLDLGIEEDINTGDVTTESIIPESMNAVATMTAKQEGVIWNFSQS